MSDFKKKIEIKKNGFNPEKIFYDIFFNSAIGMCLVDTDGSMLVSSPSLEKILGYKDSELKLMNFKDITYSEDLEKDITEFKKIINNKSNFYKINKRYIKKDGSIIKARLHVTGIRDTENNLVCFFLR